MRVCTIYRLRETVARQAGRAGFLLSFLFHLVTRRWRAQALHRGLVTFRQHYAEDDLVSFSSEEQELLPQYEGCINCGLCTARCIVLRSLLRANDQYAGPRSIATCLSRAPNEFWASADTLYYCSTCGACESVCPAGVPISGMVEMMRSRIFDQRPRLVPEAHRALLSNLQTRGNIYGTELSRLVKPCRPAEYIFFVGCVSSHLERESIEATMRLLERLDVRYTLVDERCCGGPSEVVGVPFVPALAEHNMDAFRSAGSHKLITACPRCAITLSTHPLYAGLHVEHILRFLQRHGIGQTAPPPAEMTTYHDPCELGRACGDYDSARALIRSAGLRFQELEGNREMSDCCGAGGGLRGAHTRLSLEIARRRLLKAQEGGADVLLTECPACLHNFRNACRSRDRIRVYNLSEYLSRIEEGAGREAGG